MYVTKGSELRVRGGLLVSISYALDLTRVKVLILMF